MKPCPFLRLATILAMILLVGGSREQNRRAGEDCHPSALFFLHPGLRRTGSETLLLTAFATLRIGIMVG